MKPGTAEWLAQIVEDIVDASQRIIDPHHHLWPEAEGLPYGLNELHADTGDGHNIEATVFIECGASYESDGPEHLRPVGETRFVAEKARTSAEKTGAAEIRGIVAHADLRLGARLDEVLNAHVDAGGDLVKGMRHRAAFDSGSSSLMIPGRGPAGIYGDPEFRAGVALLGERGFSFDAWHFHHQNREFADLAAAVPGTTLVLNHFGTPLGVGDYVDRREEIFETWKADIAAIARYPNVVAKIGGLAMPDNGFGWHERSLPAASDELVEAQARYFLHTIECFGPHRCMFESNFPIDRFSISYRTFWNAAKKMAATFTPKERDLMFYGTAKNIYCL